MGRSLGQDCASGQWSDREVVVNGSEDINIDLFVLVHAAMSVLKFSILMLLSKLI